MQNQTLPRKVTLFSQVKRSKGTWTPVIRRTAGGPDEKTTGRGNHRVEGQQQSICLSDCLTHNFKTVSGSCGKMNVVKVAAAFLMLLCLLLLAALIGLGVQYIQDQTSCRRKASQMWMNNVNLTADGQELLRSNSKMKDIIHNLSQKITRLQTDRNKLKANNSELMRDREDFKKQVLENARCSADWMQFGNVCYLFFTSPMKTWNESKYDCQSRGAQLAIIPSEDEMKFTFGFINKAWIGLTDEENEGDWKWVDGTSANTTHWRKKQPDNWNGKEDCAEINVKEWNDLPCSSPNHWICNKKLP
ncbi:uncharacterized protein LOC143016654 [Genypterus blacodes]|uniref:uncharacterized protein LOC143016654 n=1 Tax=Genypterus blacodes TaxID=154954 RepID=UPI003F7606EC